MLRWKERMAFTKVVRKERERLREIHMSQARNKKWGCARNEQEVEGTPTWRRRILSKPIIYVMQVCLILCLSRKKYRYFIFFEILVTKAASC